MTESPVELSVVEARTHLADILNAASVRGRITYITNRGRRIAAIVPLGIAEDADCRNGLTPP